MKRFYKVVSTGGDNGAPSILLDGKAIKTGAGHVLSPPRAAIAQAVMQEWAAQGEMIIPDTMPLTQILNTKQDRVATERQAMQAAILKYLDTDLVCYLAEEPADLVAMQDERWGAHRTWCAQHYGETLATTITLAAVTQPAALHEKIAADVAGMDDDLFTLLQLVTALSGSLILALAFVHGRASAADVVAAAFVEEDHKDGIYDADKYGADPLIEKKKAALILDMNAAALYLEALTATK